jgi:hypothetical protein
MRRAKAKVSAGREFVPLYSFKKRLHFEMPREVAEEGKSSRALRYPFLKRSCLKHLCLNIPIQFSSEAGHERLKCYPGKVT